MQEVLKAKRILVVDDEPDIIQNLMEILDFCFIESAMDFGQAERLLKRSKFDAAVLDIMGVEGYKLLDLATKRDIPTVMLTAYALTPEALEKSIKLGAVSFLPKEKMSELDDFIADVVLKGGQPVWEKLFDSLGGFFNKHFGPDWKQRNEFFEEFEKSLHAEKDAD